MSRAVRFAPLALLLAIGVALVWRLATPPDTAVHSTLEGRPVPAFRLPPSLPSKPALSSADLTSGRPHLLNIFASWCVPCITEVKVLQTLRDSGVRVEGIAVRDRPDDLAAFLAGNGDPYERPLRASAPSRGLSLSAFQERRRDFAEPIGRRANSAPAIIWR